MAPTTPTSRQPLSAVLPPLILGTATFNTQYVSDPLSMPYERIVSRALELGVRAFDTSPYYGPSELLLGAALAAATSSRDQSSPSPPRSSLFLITKAGRIGPSEFDYSAAHVRRSVRRSLSRLRTPYLDLVYAHDVEFVSPAEVLCAVRELRRLRDEEGGCVRHVGISGYPVDVLCALAELVLRETGEPLDAVMSYGHFTVQNRTLGLPEALLRESESGPAPAASPLSRLRAAGVDVVLNASMLGMGLLTTAGIPPDSKAPAADAVVSGSPLAVWHPSPPALRLACQRLSALATSAGERLESVAIRWSLGEWARVAAAAELGVRESSSSSSSSSSASESDSRSVGATVMGVSSVAELEETVAEWEGVRCELRSSAAPAEGVTESSGTATQRARHEKIIRLVEQEMWPALGPEWLDYSWASPGVGYVNQRVVSEEDVVPEKKVILGRPQGPTVTVTETAVIV